MTKIDIISGFLGAGKTTLIKKLLREAFQGEKVVLIENEFGEIGIDGGFLKDAGIEITEMNSGCICCSLVGDFGTALKDVLDKFHPERIIIEPSGVGKLSDVIKAVQNVQDQTDMVLNSFTTVADANKCKMYMKNFGEFYNNQIENAGTVILSRTDHIKEEKLEKAVKLLQEKNAEAAIITTPWEELNGMQILKTMERQNSLVKELMEEVIICPECGCHHGQEEHHHAHHEETCSHGQKEQHHTHHEETCSHGQEEQHYAHHEEACSHGQEEQHHAHHEEACSHGQKEQHHAHHEETCSHGQKEQHYAHHEETCSHGQKEHHHAHHEGACSHGQEEQHHDHHTGHEHGETCECGHDHSHGETCGCGHDHHHADDVFTSWGTETPKKYERKELEQILKTLSSNDQYGMILRAKGMLSSTDGGWMYFDLVPGEYEIREGSPDYTGRLCVIGSGIHTEEIEELFQLK